MLWVYPLRFFKGRLSILPNEKPKLSDWVDHLTTIFPEVRLKQFIEMRGRMQAMVRICAFQHLGRNNL